MSGAPIVLPESASVLHTGLDVLWSRVSGTAQWSWVQLLGCFSCYPQCEPQPGPQQGGSRCHHNLTVCWTSHDRAISGPGLPTCCQFHWSQSSQIINNVPAPHLHLRLTPPLIQYISHWHCVALWTFSDDVMASKLLACAKSFFVRAANCGIKHD